MTDKKPTGKQLMEIAIKQAGDFASTLSPVHQRNFKIIIENILDACKHEQFELMYKYLRCL